MLTLSPKLPVLPSTCRGNWCQRPVFTKANSSRLGMQQGTTTQPVGLRSLGVSRFLFLYISTCILYDSQHSRAFGNSHFGWWVKYLPWPPQPWSDLLGISQNLWPPGCYHPLAALVWLAGMWSRTREKLAWQPWLLLVISLWLSFFLRDVDMWAAAFISVKFKGRIFYRRPLPRLIDFNI